jgi:phosphoserine aminotransferase
MISFYPGPSRVYDDIPGYVKDAHRKGILSMNHRSDEFMAIYKNTAALLVKKLNVPRNYSVYFSSSATECWEMIAQSLIEKESIHIFNGAFGEKWFDYTKKLIPDAKAVSFDPQTEIDAKSLVYQTGNVICLTQNETSNGTQLTKKIIISIRKQNPEHLIAIDAVSSMAGIELDFKLADVWFASVQKCFGLPAGLAVMICSPRAIEKIKSLGENKHYNSLSLVNNMKGKWQTSCTPNVLGIYLLMRTLNDVKPIAEVSEQTMRRITDWQKFFQHSKNLQLLIKNPSVRSQTILTITGQPEYLQKLKVAAKKKGFLLGEGYGSLRKETFRIANFPAIRKKEIHSLQKFLSDYI